jgi:hypothetical protein
MGNCIKYINKYSNDISNNITNNINNNITNNISNDISNNISNHSSNDNNIINYTLYFYNNPTLINIKYSTFNGELDGEHLMFDRQGKLISKSFYKKGKLLGKKTDYNVFMCINGEIIKVKIYEQLYEDGVEISTNIIL